MGRTIDDARRAATACTKCALSASRTQVVYGSGDPSAELMFVGEAPGFHEDRKGLPFVGAAGSLLTGLIEGIGLQREQVYIANVLKCRPPANRDPQPEEIDACHTWLLEQVELVDPLVICTLGNFSTKLLLQTESGISRVRGRRFEYRGRALVPTFHPAAVLHSGRNGTQMAQMEEDFKTVAVLLEELRASSQEPPFEADPDAEQLGLF